MKIIDRKDRKLLSIVSKNARLSQGQLSRLSQMSREVVNYRIKRLEREGIIKNYVAHFQNRIFGIDNYVFMIKLQSFNKEAEKRIITSISKVDYVKHLVRGQGEYDLIALVGSKNKVHLSQLANSISNICGRNLKEFVLGIQIKNLKTDDMSFLLDDFKYEEKHRQSPKDLKIDDIDRKIIKILSQNGKKPILEVASEIGMTPEMTSRRLKRLIRDRAITSINAIVDIEKLGYERYNVCLKLNIYTFEKELRIKSMIKDISNITFAERLLGNWDLRFNIVAENFQKFSEVLERLRGLFGSDLNSYCFTLISEEIKRAPYVGK